MKGDFEYIDALVRSLNTIKEMLEIRGFNTESMPKFSPVEIRSAVSTEDSTLNFQLKHREDDTYTADIRFGRVTRNSFPTILTEIKEMANEKRDIIFIIPEKVAVYHHIFAKKVWAETKKLINFFTPSYIVINPLTHVLVPKHEIVKSDDATALLKNIHAYKRQLPILAFHEDPIGRFIGAKPGDIIHIQRPSPSAGVYDVYRVCA
jgi:DNA-directed RNA polymerase subunit H (RpoH/RPB5)